MDYQKNTQGKEKEKKWKEITMKAMKPAAIMASERFEDPTKSFE